MFGIKKNKKKVKSDGILRAPVPGTVLRIEAAVGQRIQSGDSVLIMDAMRMQIPVAADVDGVITDIYVHEGDRLEKDMPVAVLQMDETI